MFYPTIALITCVPIRQLVLLGAIRPTFLPAEESLRTVDGNQYVGGYTKFTNTFANGCSTGFNIHTPNFKLTVLLSLVLMLGNSSFQKWFVNISNSINTTNDSTLILRINFLNPLGSFTQVFPVSGLWEIIRA